MCPVQCVTYVSGRSRVLRREFPVQPQRESSFARALDSGFSVRRLERIFIAAALHLDGHGCTFDGRPER